ncbi:uncharacterized protein EDB91DRAFT_1248977 [Suillus paluster]|uniref:uncharacterized protein n=1 Tax=Suillus paluster TaxID=48578 RepID=UPI001B86612D|nr:uncharacterized protein EDB91DRAFT_1248977 [Suillus paluster]KAG1738817.1 hypothetical protein EDB91DRAFT_1248977 [Suillus paluster]
MGQWTPTFKFKTLKTKERMNPAVEEEVTKHESTMGSEELPLREVSPHSSDSQQLSIDLPDPVVCTTDINVIMEDTNNQLLGDLPEPAPSTANPFIYTWQTDLLNAARVREIKCQITLGDDLTAEEVKELNEFIAKNADIFALALKEVLPIPGATLNLNIPENATFNM